MTLYFAYGSNLNQEDLNLWCIRHKRPKIDLAAKKPHKVMLDGFELVFDYFSKISRKCGVADLKKSEGKYVEGVLFEMSEEEMKTIDEKEGPKVYHRQKVLVTLKNGQRVEATTYMVKDELRGNGHVPPSNGYLKLIINGAEKFELSENWINFLSSIETLTV